MEASGIIIFDKPEGMSSQTAVHRVARLLGVRTAGHTGTLDPMATGVLPVLIGRAVKASEYVTEADKHYSATLTLGCTTDTEDSTGQVLTVCDTIPSREQVTETVEGFVGTVSQIPPMYSALKVGGRKLCDIARSGGEVERKPRDITVYSMTAEMIDDRSYRLEVHCSKGTYIRTLCADIGKALGCGGIMSSLRRTEAAGFSLRDAVTEAKLQSMSPSERAALVLSLEDTVFKALSSYIPEDFFLGLLRHGCAVEIRKLKGLPVCREGERVKLCDGEGFFALGEIKLKDDKLCLCAVKHFRL